MTPNAKVFYQICRLFLAVFLMACWMPQSQAQAGRGGISGAVTDQTGAIVPGARVVAVNQATSISLSTVSSAAGIYSFVSLTPGTYTVTASHEGFESIVRQHVGVNI